MSMPYGLSSMGFPKGFAAGIRRIFSGLVLMTLFPSVSDAIPAFARKHDLSCASCHTKPPRLNPFGEAFHMAGFQIPMIRDEERKGKRRVGRVFLETDLLNIFSGRVTGDFLEGAIGGKKNSGGPSLDKSELNLTLPQSFEVYFAGTLAPNTSYFFEIEGESGEIEGNELGEFEEVSGFGIGKEFFLMVNLGAVVKGLSPKGEAPAHSPGKTMLMGPMVMIGKVDPSTNFSYPTNRQFILNVPGRAEEGSILRYTFAPYAFASKFFGLENGKGEPVEVTRSVLYNSTGDFAVDFHAMTGPVMVQAGLMQGLEGGTTDINAKKDPYVMGRMNFGGGSYTSGSVSGLAYWGNDTARVAGEPVDWFRYGFSGNIKYRLLDLYGAVIWDKVRDVSEGISQVFDDSAFGMTVEADFIASDRILLSIRYDQLQAGGFKNQKTNGRVFSGQVRYYIRENFALFFRDSQNIKEVSLNPLQNFRNIVTFGVDLDF